MNRSIRFLPTLRAWGHGIRVIKSEIGTTRSNKLSLSLSLSLSHYVKHNSCFKIALDLMKECSHLFLLSPLSRSHHCCSRGGGRVLWCCVQHHRDVQAVNNFVSQNLPLPSNCEGSKKLGHRRDPCAERKLKTRTL